MASLHKNDSAIKAKSTAAAKTCASDKSVTSTSSKASNSSPKNNANHPNGMPEELLNSREWAEIKRTSLGQLVERHEDVKRYLKTELGENHFSLTFDMNEIAPGLGGDKGRIAKILSNMKEKKLKEKREADEHKRIQTMLSTRFGRSSTLVRRTTVGRMRGTVMRPAMQDREDIK